MCLNIDTSHSLYKHVLSCDYSHVTRLAIIPQGEDPDKHFTTALKCDVSSLSTTYQC